MGRGHSHRQFRQVKGEGNEGEELTIAVDPRLLVCELTTSGGGAGNDERMQEGQGLKYRA